MPSIQKLLIIFSCDTFYLPRFSWALMFLSDSDVIVHFIPSDTACTAPLISVLYMGMFLAAQRSITSCAGNPNWLKTVI
jgi:hypothetical protein